MTRVIMVTELLVQLEGDLRRSGYWEQHPPSREALASTQPFCVDTLDFPQWLQWVFVPRMQLLVKQNSPLPTQCGIAPMGEEYFRGSQRRNVETLLNTLRDLDALLSQPS